MLLATRTICQVTRSATTSGCAVGARFTTANVIINTRSPSQRTFSSGPEIAEADFHRVADDTLERIGMALEDLEECVGDDLDIIETVRFLSLLFFAS